MKKMTKKEGKDYLKRWGGVHKVLVKEWRNTSLSERLRDFFVILDAFTSLVADKRRSVKREEEQAVSKRWARLRYHFLHG